MKIFKYPVPINDYFTIELPRDAEILSFQEQDGLLFLWALVSPNRSKESRRFSVIGTGHEIDMDNVKNFIGTVQLNGGALVLHLFELI